MNVSQTTSHAISESDSRHENSQDLASGEVCMYDCVHLLVGYLSPQDLTDVILEVNSIALIALIGNVLIDRALRKTGVRHGGWLD